MSSGYEKSDEYGGPPPRWPVVLYLLLAIVLITAATAVAIYF
jgi:hypothetical protein